MAEQTVLAPPYSVLFITDADLGDEAPELDGRHAGWTDSCISITCLNDQDGDTTVTLGPLADVARFDAPVVDRVIATPSREVVVSTAHLDVVLRLRVSSVRTRVRVWDNHAYEPDDIVIGLG